MKEPNILFIGYGILGDHIVCFRSLELLKEKYPNSRIVFVGNPVFAEIGLQFGNGIIDEVIDIEVEELMSYYAKPTHYSKYWNEIFQETDILINHKMDNGGFFSGNLVSKGVKWVRTKTSDNELNTFNKILLQDKVINGNRNAYAQVGELVELLNISTDNWQTTLNVSLKRKHLAKQNIEKYFNYTDVLLIAFHPGSSSPEKNYPIEKWALAINKMLTENSKAKLLVLVGPNEQSLIPKIKVLFPMKQTMIVNENLIESIALLSLCNLFLGHDTGFAHIAASLKINSVLLFGQGSSNIWEPPTAFSNVIRAETLNSIDYVNIYNLAIEKLVLRSLL